MLSFLWRPALRWVLVAAVLFQVNYRPGTDNTDRALLNLMALAAVGLNALLQWLLTRRRGVWLGFPIALGFYDTGALTIAVAAVDGFDNASTVEVTLEYAPAETTLTVQDNGRGFAGGAGETAVRAGHGLRNMEERAMRLGGQLTIETRHGEGTRLRLAVPFAEPAPARALAPER